MLKTCLDGAGLVFGQSRPRWISVLFNGLRTNFKDSQMNCRSGRGAVGLRWKRRRWVVVEFRSSVPRRDWLIARSDEAFANWMRATPCRRDASVDAGQADRELKRSIPASRRRWSAWSNRAAAA